MNAIQLSGVSKTFANVTVAVAPLDLKVAEGSFTSLVGPSGCGKSTLLRLITGLASPSSGTVLRAAEAAATSFVFQDPTLMPWATAAENVALPLQLVGTGEIESKVQDALARVGLDGFAQAYPRELSGGMRMRVSIARAIVTGPKLLLMDEPFAALDEFTRFKLNADMHTLWRQNRWTVVFVTHSIREAVFLSERVIVMSPRPGRIVGDVTVDLPAARTPELRLSHAFSDQCAAVSGILGAAVGMKAAS